MSYIIIIIITMATLLHNQSDSRIHWQLLLIAKLLVKYASGNGVKEAHKSFVKVQTNPIK